MRQLRFAAVLIAALQLGNAWAQAPYSRFDDATTADAIDGDVSGTAWTRWSQRSAAALAATGQARDLAFAAVLVRAASADPQLPDTAAPAQPSPADPQSIAWRRDAAAKAGNDILANVLIAYRSDDATRLRAAQRWLGSDPQNLAPLLMRGGDIDALLSDARAATRFDLHMLEQVRWMQAALLRTPPTTQERAALADAGEFVPAEHAAIMAMALWSAMAIPGLHPLMQACDATATRADAARQQDCRHIARLMADHSDTQLGTMLGLALLERAAVTAAERADVQTRRRALDWRNLEWGRASMALPRDGAPQFLRLLADPAIRTEDDLVRRALQEAGVAPEPPAGWQPPR